MKKNNLLMLTTALVCLSSPLLAAAESQGQAKNSVAVEQTAKQASPMMEEQDLNQLLVQPVEQNAAQPSAQPAPANAAQEKVNAKAKTANEAKPAVKPAKEAQNKKAPMDDKNPQQAMKNPMLDDQMPNQVADKSHTDHADQAYMDIKESLSLFLKNNPDLSSVMANRTAIDHELSQAYAGFLPRLDVEGSTGYEKKWRKRPATDTSMHRSDATAKLTQNVFAGFETVNQVKRGKSRLVSANNRVYSNSEFLGLDVVQSYVEIFKQRQILKHSESNLDVHRKILNLIEQRNKSGTGNKADLNQAQSRFALANATKRTVVGDIQDSEASFEKLVGVYPGELDKPMFPTDHVPATMMEALDQAFKSNPNLLSAEADKETAEHETGVVDAKFYPSIDGEVEGRTSHNRDGIRGPDSAFAAKVVGRWNLFAGGADVNEHKESVARQQEANYKATAARLAVQEEVKKAWTDLEEARNRKKHLKGYMDANRQVKELYMEQFKIGQRTLLDVLDIENEFFQSQSEYTTAEAAEIFAGYRILAAMGQLMSSQNLTTP